MMKTRRFNHKSLYKVKVNIDYSIGGERLYYQKTFILPFVPQFHSEIEYTLNDEEFSIVLENDSRNTTRIIYDINTNVYSVLLNHNWGMTIGFDEFEDFQSKHEKSGWRLINKPDFDKIAERLKDYQSNW